MYIPSDNEASFKKYIRLCGFAPASIRNIDSDVSFFFKWLRTRNYAVDISTVIEEFEGYLMSIKSNENTSRRRLSTIVKFLQWYRETQLPPESVRSVVNQVATKGNIHISGDTQRTIPLRKMGHKYYMYLTLFLLIAIGILSIVFLTNYQSNVDPISKVNSNNILRFSIEMRNLNKLMRRSKDILSFSYYSSDSQNSYIGYSECLLKPNMFNPNGTTLTVLVGSNCGSMPAVLDTKLSYGEHIFADLYLNDVKLNNAKLKVLSQSTVKDNSNYHNSTEYQSSVIGNSEVLLPNDLLNDKNAAFSYPTEASVAGIMDSRLSVESLTNRSSFQDGDVVGYLNGQIDRALMSAKVIGVLSGNFILTEGVTTINYLETSDVIQAGDYVSTSIEPGYGTKANNLNTNIFGIALEPYSTSSGKLKVLLNTP